MNNTSLHLANIGAIRNSLSSAQRSEDYRLLRIYAYYRTLLGSILLMIFLGDFASKYLGEKSPTLFIYTITIYTTLNVVTLSYLWAKKFAPNALQIIGILLVDILALTLIVHASGTLDIGYLILVSVAAGSIFLHDKTNLVIAGFASLLILAESIYSFLSGTGDTQGIISAVIFGILVFSTAYLFGILSEKIRRSNQTAFIQAQQAAYLERLSQVVVERMRTGIVVVNSQNHLIMANQAAKQLLGLKDLNDQADQKIEPLLDQLSIWRAFPHTRSPSLKIQADGPEIRINFANLEDKEDSDALIFIEDNRQLSQQAQQLKLASLGRLTASIAHEIRNPLGAISHAAQLLSESEHLHDADKRLGEIIQNHSRRVNHIIENIMQLSRRKGSTPERIDLTQWLPTFIQEYRQTHQATILLDLTHAQIETRIDTSQLQQVLTNLCDNGLRYSKELTGQETVTVEAGIDSESELPYIAVIDEGVGIAESDVAQVFEPFFTTASTGSGLGLYISRELCEANQASLIYKRTPAGKSCFLIKLAHPQRIF